MNEEEYPYPLFNENGRVNCQICGKAFQVISPRHLKYKHNIEYIEYTTRFKNAPLSSEEFIARGKYGKARKMFDTEDPTEAAKKSLEVEIDAELDLDELDEVEIEEKAIKEFYEKEIKSAKENPTLAMKDKIFRHLQMYLSNVKMDFKIQVFSLNGRLEYECITDYCDPVLKIVIDFPRTFWHNQTDIDPTRDTKLRAYGWKIITIASPAPKMQEITEALERI